MLKLIAALATTVLAPLLFAVPAHAESATSDRAAYARWDVATVNVYVDASVKGSGWGLARSLRAWSAGPVQLKVVADPARAHISVREVPRSPEFNGEATYAALDGMLVSCSIELVATVRPARRPHIAAHELGHCLGLPHVSEYHSVMDVWLRGTWSGPTPGDLAWLEDCYGA